MRRESTDPALDAGNNPFGPARVRVGRTTISPIPINRELAILIVVATIGLFWFLGVEPDRETARMRTDRGDPRARTIAFAFSPDRATIATVCLDGRVVVGGPREDWSLRRSLGYHGPVRAVALAPDGRSLALGGVGPGITVCDLGTEGAERSLQVPIQATSALMFSPDGRVLAATSFMTNEIILWDMAASRERARLRGHSSPVISLAFSPDGRTLAAGGFGDQPIIVWDLATGGQRLRLADTPGPVSVNGLAYSPDGSLLASTCREGGSVRLWDRAGRVVRRLACHLQSLGAVAFAPDGRLLATADNFGTVKLWSVATGRLLASLDSHEVWLWGAEFSADGRTLAAVGSTNGLRLWDVAEVIGAHND